MSPRRNPPTRRAPAGRARLFEPGEARPRPKFHSRRAPTVGQEDNSYRLDPESLPCAADRFEAMESRGLGHLRRSRKRHRHLGATREEWRFPQCAADACGGRPGRRGGTTDLRLRGPRGRSIRPRTAASQRGSRPQRIRHAERLTLGPGCCRCGVNHADRQRLQEPHPQLCRQPRRGGSMSELGLPEQGWVRTRDPLQQQEAREHRLGSRDTAGLGNDQTSPGPARLPVSGAWPSVGGGFLASPVQAILPPVRLKFGVDRAAPCKQQRPPSATACIWRGAGLSAAPCLRFPVPSCPRATGVAQPVPGQPLRAGAPGEMAGLPAAVGRGCRLRLRSQGISTTRGLSRNRAQCSGNT